MRGTDKISGSLFSYVDIEDRIPARHPLRQVKRIVDEALASLDAEFDRLYAAEGRPSIAPERLMRASLIQILFSVRSERQLMEQMQYNLLFRWFVGLGVDDAVWVPTVFAKNRDRLLTTEMSRKFLAAVLAHREVAPLLSDEHFSVDGTLIKAWASMKSFQPRPLDAPPDDGGPGEPPAAAPDPNADQPAPEAAAETAPMPSPARRDRNGLIVQAELTHADGHAERRAALDMIHRHSPGSTRRLTLGADKGYDSADFVAELRKACVTPHVAQKARHSAIDGRTTRHAGYTLSKQRRKKIEEPFGWAKTVVGMAQTVHRGLDRVRARFTLTMAACNLARLPKLLAA
jgi:transposase